VFPFNDIDKIAYIFVLLKGVPWFPFKFAGGVLKGEAETQNNELVVDLFFGALDGYLCSTEPRVDVFANSEDVTHYPWGNTAVAAPLLLILGDWLLVELFEDFLDG
jgi:hypothetical protein